MHTMLRLCSARLSNLLRAHLFCCDRVKRIHRHRVSLQKEISAIEQPGKCLPDPEAADLVLGYEAKIRVVGLDVTHSCLFTAEDLQGLAGQGRFGTFLHEITRFYLQYHRCRLAVFSS